MTTDENLFYTEIFTQDFLRKFKVEKSFFALPVYLIEGQKKGRVLTDREPFIWEQ